MAQCKWGLYCQKQCNCGHTHDSLDEINEMWLSPEERQRINQVYQKYRSRIEYVIYYGGGCYRPHLFYKRYRYIYGTSFVKMPKHIFIHVILRIKSLKIKQVPLGIRIEIRSNEICKYALKDMYARINIYNQKIQHQHQ